MRLHIITSMTARLMVFFITSFLTRTHFNSTSRDTEECRTRTSPRQAGWPTFARLLFAGSFNIYAADRRSLAAKVAPPARIVSHFAENGNGWGTPVIGRGITLAPVIPTLASNSRRSGAI